MDCKQFSDDFSAYLDGEVSPARAKSINVHIENCPDCAEEFYTLEESARFVEMHAREIPLSPGSWASLKARLSPRNTTLRRWKVMPLFSGLRPLVASAALAVVALILGLWGLGKFQKKEQDIQQYMNAYIEAREQQENIHRKAMMAEAPASHPSIDRPTQNTENPFVSDEPVFAENPFRMEGQ